MSVLHGLCLLITTLISTSKSYDHSFSFPSSVLLDLLQTMDLTCSCLASSGGSNTLWVIGFFLSLWSQIIPRSCHHQTTASTNRKFFRLLSWDSQKATVRKNVFLWICCRERLLASFYLGLASPADRPSIGTLCAWGSYYKRFEQRRIF